MSTLGSKLDLPHFPGYWVGRFEGLRDKWMEMARIEKSHKISTREVAYYVRIARMHNQELVRELRKIRAARSCAPNWLLKAQAS